MDEQLSHKKNLIYGTLIALLIGGAGVSMGMQFAQCDTIPVDVEASRQAGYMEGFAAARTLVENSKLGDFFKAPEDQRSFFGTVTGVDIEKGQIFLTPDNINPFEDASLTERVVLISEETVIATLSPAEGAEAGKILEAPAELSTIVVGDTISIIAAENARGVKEFSVVKILVQRFPSFGTTNP